MVLEVHMLLCGINTWLAASCISTVVALLIVTVYVHVYVCMFLYMLGRCLYNMTVSDNHIHVYTYIIHVDI